MNQDIATCPNIHGSHHRGAKRNSTALMISYPLHIKYQCPGSQYIQKLKFEMIKSRCRPLHHETPL
jgi:hypothetical protein